VAGLTQAATAASSAGVSPRPQAQVELEDSYLIALAKQGRPDAYNRILKRYHGFVRLKASSYFLIGGDADDLIQEGLVGLYKPLNEYVSFSQTPASSGADGDPTLDELLPGPSVHDPVNQVISTEELKSLVTCLSSVLSELESSVLSLYLDGYSYEVIGERLDCDTKTVDNALQRVKRKVGSHLDSRAVPA
jgi:RNA polymerase sporulation-specific sigma factor